MDFENHTNAKAAHSTAIPKQAKEPIFRHPQKEDLDFKALSLGMDKPTIYTIGHSTHQLDYFLELLKTYSVSCVIDVRSVAASSYNPQYNQEPLSNFLKNNRVTYLHFGEEFGARHRDPDLLDEDGKVDFEKVRKS